MVSLSEFDATEQSWIRARSDAPRAAFPSLTGLRASGARPSMPAAYAWVTGVELCPQLPVTPLRTTGGVRPQAATAAAFAFVDGYTAVIQGDAGVMSTTGTDTYDPGTTVWRAPV